jgi:hypothetical protein
MRIRVPRKKVSEQFLVVYELYGCQRAVNFLSEYYGVKRMKIVLNGKKLGRGYEAFYFEGKAYFSKRSLNKRNVLHEFYHHLVETKRLEISERLEEKQANAYANELVKKC